jgi:hypothetical protein
VLKPSRLLFSLIIDMITMKTKSKIHNKKVEEIKLFEQDIREINQNLKVLWENDKMLDNKIAVIHNLQQDIIQQQQVPVKKISISDEGVQIESRQAWSDLKKILNDNRAKEFFDTCRKNSIMKKASCSYID